MIHFKSAFNTAINIGENVNGIKITGNNVVGGVRDAMVVKSSRDVEFRENLVAFIMNLKTFGKLHNWSFKTVEFEPFGFKYPGGQTKLYDNMVIGTDKFGGGYFAKVKSFIKFLVCEQKYFEFFFRERLFLFEV